MKKSLGPRISANPTPVWVIGSYDAQGRPNVMTAAWAGVCSSKPPCVAVSLRPATYSHGSILARRAFSVSIPSRRNMLEADYMGMASGREADKFAAAGLTPARCEHVDAPYVAEFPLILECKVLHVHDLGMHTQFVGEVMNVLADESALNAEGKPDMDLIQPFVYSPDTRSYHMVGPLAAKDFSVGMPLVERKEGKA